MILSGLSFTQFVYADVETRFYDQVTLDSPWTSTHWDDIWDLTQGDLVLSYVIDMRNLTQPGNYSTFERWQTSYTQVGLRGEGASDFNPGPWNTYQGWCGGWMNSDSDTWLDSDGYTEKGDPDPDGIQDLDDKHNLQCSGGRGERDYDILLSDPDTVLDPPVGSFSNYGVWFDRDGVDPWQDNNESTPGPNPSNVPWTQRDGRKTYNTGGVYNITITYHAIEDDLGVMFATINGDPYGEIEVDPIDTPVPQGFVRLNNGSYQYYPAGLSFKGDMMHMQVFAGLWAPSAPSGHDYGAIIVSEITVKGVLGDNDPLVPEFGYSSPIVGVPIEFIDGTRGGMPPYTHEWDFDDDNIVDSTEQNPSWVYDNPGEYNVTLRVIPHRCVVKEVTKTINVCSPRVGGTLKELTTTLHEKLTLIIALLMLGASIITQQIMTYK